MLNYNWVIPAGTLETGVRSSACEPVVLQFKQFVPENTLSERVFKGATINDPPRKKKNKEKSLC
jgi:hypothetical protein